MQWLWPIVSGFAKFQRERSRRFACDPACVVAIFATRQRHPDAAMASHARFAEQAKRGVRMLQRRFDIAEHRHAVAFAEDRA
jgi:hypothetical protein